MNEDPEMSIVTISEEAILVSMRTKKGLFMIEMLCLPCFAFIVLVLAASVTILGTKIPHLATVTTSALLWFLFLFTLINGWHVDHGNLFLIFETISIYSALENVLAVKGLGFQCGTRYRNGCWRYSFVPSSQIQKIIILEGVHRLQFVYYIAIAHVAKPTNSSSLIVVFPVSKTIVPNH